MSEELLASLSGKLRSMGHKPRPWTKGRGEFHTNCTACKAFVSVVKGQVKEFPADTCERRLERIQEMKRGYSREFTPENGVGQRFMMDRIPDELWAEVREKAKKERVSLRALILELLSGWVEGKVKRP